MTEEGRDVDRELTIFVKDLVSHWVTFGNMIRHQSADESVVTIRNYSITHVISL